MARVKVLVVASALFVLVVVGCALRPFSALLLLGACSGVLWALRGEARPFCALLGLCVAAAAGDGPLLLRVWLLCKRRGE